MRVAYLQKITCQPGLRTGESFFEEMELLTERTNYAGRVRTNHVGSRTGDCWLQIAHGVRMVIGKSQWAIVYFVQPTNRPYCEP